jgi:hypothetical protein
MSFGLGMPQAFARRALLCYIDRVMPDPVTRQLHAG